MLPLRVQGKGKIKQIDVYKMNRRIPRILGQILSFEIFTQSESMGSTTYILTSSNKNLRKLTICKLWVNRRMALRDFMKCRNAVRIDNAWRVELGHSIRRFIKLCVPCVSVAWTTELRIDSRALINHPAHVLWCTHETLMRFLAQYSSLLIWIYMIWKKRNYTLMSCKCILKPPPESIEGTVSKQGKL